MSDNGNKARELDEFWDISSLVPRKAPLRVSSKNTETVEITDSRGDDNRSTVIERFIPPHYKNELKPNMEEHLSYVPENSLIHKVTLYKENSAYEFYSEFVKDARRLCDVHGTKAPYSDFFSYSPQYDQMNDAQLAYYLWWRENVRSGVYIKTNLYYIYLYMFELINVSNEENAQESLDMMVSVVIAYADIIKGALSKCIRWISDFGLIHRLPSPTRYSEQLLSQAGTLKEYFVRIPGNTPVGWARMLLAYCCSYDYKTSKFATEENLPLYDEHIIGALSRVVQKLSENGRILSGLPFGDCKVNAKAFEGAICSSALRYTLSVEYCSFSRSHELRFIVGDTVKYAENKIRAHLGIKSKLTVYSLPQELCLVVDEYFKSYLPVVRRTVKREEKPCEYDVLYELPKRELDLSNAAKIELESWDTTRELVGESVSDEPIQNVVQETLSTEEDDGFGIYLEALRALHGGNSSVLLSLARSMSKPAEAVVDMINEKAVEIIGDIIIEDTDGRYVLIEDYADDIFGGEKTDE